MTDLRTRIADILDDFGLRSVTARETAAEAILNAIAQEQP